MALNTFGALKTAAADWAWGEVTTALVGTDFFPQVQSKMYYGDKAGGIQPLRLRQMVATATLTPSTAGLVTISTAVDSGWLEFIELTPTALGARALSYLEPWDFRKRQDLLDATGVPASIYTIYGDTLEVAPPSAGTLVAAWYEKFTALSGDSDVDWVLTNAPQVYLNGCLMEACAYLQDNREAEFRAKFAGAIMALNLNDRNARQSGAVKVARPRVVE